MKTFGDQILNDFGGLLEETGNTLSEAKTPSATAIAKFLMAKKDIEDGLDFQRDNGFDLELRVDGFTDEWSVAGRDFQEEFETLKEAAKFFSKQLSTKERKRFQQEMMETQESEKPSGRKLDECLSLMDNMEDLLDDDGLEKIKKRGDRIRQRKIDMGW